MLRKKILVFFNRKKIDRTQKVIKLVTCSRLFLQDLKYTNLCLFSVDPGTVDQRSLPNIDFSTPRHFARL